MKRLILLGICMAAVFTLIVSCQEKQEQQIRISFSTIDDIEYSGGNVEIPFSADCPLSATPFTEAEWISELTLGSESITFIADKNMGKERYAEINLEIPSDINIIFSSSTDNVIYSKSDRIIRITVTQKAYSDTPSVNDSAIEIRINNKNYHCINVSYIPKNNDITYIARIVEKEYFDSFESDNAYIHDEIDEFIRIAGNDNVDPSIVISANLRQGPIENLDIDGLKASSGYCIYAYGLQEDGTVTTGLCKEFVDTDNVETLDFGFGFHVSPMAYGATITITTSSDNNTYYWSTMTLDEWNAYSTENDIINETVEVLDFAVEVMGDSYYDFLESGTENVFDCNDLNEATEYIVFAFGMDGYGNPTSGISYEQFTTLEETVDNPCTFDISFSEITTINCIVNVTPSDNSTRYYVGMMFSTDFAEMTPDEAARYFIDMENGNSIDWAGDEYIYTGPSSLASDNDLYMGQLTGNTTYTAVAFGVDLEGNRTTVINHANVTTLPVQPSSMNIEIDVINVSSHSMYVNFYPSEQDEQYFLHCVPLSQYERFDNDIEFMEDVLSIYQGDLDWVLNTGDSHYDGEGYLDSETEYIVFAFGYCGGITTPLFYEIVKTLPAETSSADVEMSIEVLDGDELASENPETYGKYAGRAVIRATLTPNADAEHWYLKFYESLPDMTDDELKKDVANSYMIDPDLPVIIGADWDTTVMVAAIASDYKGDLGKLKKQIIDVKR